QFTVGTGGYSLFGAEDRTDNSEVLIDDEFGVLVLTLRPDGYDWSFLTTDGDEEDGGSADCH
ncbi:MAG TPA: alkaline phosphatase, partial [Methylomirabilota bacterium]|nr:alkaline phosphatase [Methylomirabilota bacterium]